MSSRDFVSLEQFVIFVGCLLLAFACWWVLFFGKALVRISNYGFKKGVDSATITYAIAGLGNLSLVLSLVIAVLFPNLLPGSAAFSAVAFLSSFGVALVLFSVMCSSIFLTMVTRVVTRKFESKSFKRVAGLLVIPVISPSVVVAILVQVLDSTLANRVILASFVWLIMLGGFVVLLCIQALIEARKAYIVIEQVVNAFFMCVSKKFLDVSTFVCVEEGDVDASWMRFVCSSRNCRAVVEGRSKFQFLCFVWRAHSVRDHLAFRNPWHQCGSSCGHGNGSRSFAGSDECRIRDVHPSSCKRVSCDSIRRIQYS